MTKAPKKKHLIGLEKDPFSYKKSVIYELHVRAFHDSNADGIGDFRGLTQKLDYLQDLGVNALWLLPFYVSPLKDDGYDIADYYSINPIYGSLADFKVFIREAHRRGLRVITELVLNHTSDQHHLFQRARRAKSGSNWRDFYVWSDTPDKYKEARIIFNEFEHSNWTWDPLAGAYYWHRFYSHQPDLNYDHPQVRQEMAKVLDFWLDLGVDGFRLDAVPYLYEREGTSCENLPETHWQLKAMRRHLDEKYGDRMLLGEANQWPEVAVTYFGSGTGDECHMAFHFPLMPRLFMAVRMEDRIPIVDVMEQTPPIPATGQWALFLRNHDELTLEMVTDEERDYMYRVYATEAKSRVNLGIRRRLAPLLSNDRRKIELLNLLLFSMPGTPVVYYGDEIGMGDNIFLGDRNGVRTPMQWSSDKNAGFSRASPQALYLPVILDPEYNYEAINVENQQRNTESLLWWMKQVLTLRKRWRAFGEGSLEFLHPENRKILAFIRHIEQERILVVANLSRSTQPVELDLSAFKGAVPVELFGRTEFPAITEQPYQLTLGPHAAYWFSLAPRLTADPTVLSTVAPTWETVSVENSWDEIFRGRSRETLESCLPAHLKLRAWFAGKDKEIRSARIRKAIPVPFDSERAFLAFVSVDYAQAETELYLLPFAFAAGKEADRIECEFPHLIIARSHIHARNVDGLLYDAVGSNSFRKALLESISRRRNFKGVGGELWTFPTPAFRQFRDAKAASLESSLEKAEPKYSSILFDSKFLLKLSRRLETGKNPDLEIGQFLTERRFPHIAAVAGALEFHRDDRGIVNVGVLNALTPEGKSAWELTLDSLGRYLGRVRALTQEAQANPSRENSILALADEDFSDVMPQILGTYPEPARLLGQRTAELHLALASDPENRDFAPEPFTPYYQRSRYQSMRDAAVHTLRLLRRSQKHLPEPARALAEKVTALEPEIIKTFRVFSETRIAATRIRCHGDYQLGQVLYTGKDFVFLNFAGDLTRSLGQRRIKRSPMYDVASMIRSFHYATRAALVQQSEAGNLSSENLAQIQPWMQFWQVRIGAAFLQAYLKATSQSSLRPQSMQELSVLLNAYLLDRAIHEAAHELNQRPDWVMVPLQGIIQLVEVANTS